MYKPLRERVLSLLLVRCLGDGPAESQSKYMFRLIANGRDFLESGGSSASPAAARGGPHAHGSPAAPHRLLTLLRRAWASFHISRHVFMCVLSIHISFFVNYPFKHFPCFLCLKMLLLLTCVCHLYSPGTCSILRISFRNIFSQSATCLYFMVLSFDGILNFDEV